jgi:hypothetical protein
MRHDSHSSDGAGVVAVFRLLGIVEMMGRRIPIEEPADGDDRGIEDVPLGLEMRFQVVGNSHICMEGNLLWRHRFCKICDRMSYCFSKLTIEKWGRAGLDL